MIKHPVVRVLIADDHHLVREGLRMILTEQPGFEVVGDVASGEDVIRLVESLRPDVVLMDLQMPGMDGIEATRRLKAAGYGGAVLILTTFGDDERVRAAIKAGALGYLLKDVLKDDLVRAIHSAARGIPTLDPRAQRLLMRQVTDPKPVSPFDELTPREREVLALVARGASNKQIAAQLSLSVGTVKGYVSAILPKLGVGDRTQAALFAVAHGFKH